MEFYLRKIAKCINICKLQTDLYPSFFLKITKNLQMKTDIISLQFMGGLIENWKIVGIAGGLLLSTLFYYQIFDSSIKTSESHIGRNCFL